MTNERFELPYGVSDAGAAAHAVIMKVLGPEASSGGCYVFQSPTEWSVRGEAYGRNSLLIVVHDGGDHAPFFNWDYGNTEAIETMDKALREAGFFAEQCTSWYSAIYLAWKEGDR